VTLIAGLVAAPFGAVVGSFAVTAGMRWARGEQALTGRSRCDGCGEGLSLARTTPLVSYVVARGACRDCRAPIAISHPVGEALSLTAAFSAFALLPPAPAALASLTAVLLVGAGAADVVARRLPDLATLGVAMSAAGLAAMRGGWDLALGAAAAIATLLILAGLKLAFARAGKAALGWGDVKLAAALALWLGAAAPWGLVLASLLGLAHLALSRPADGRLPFGPALAVGGWVVGLTLQAGWLDGVVP